jgi:hypothetical protein
MNQGKSFAFFKKNYAFYMVIFWYNLGVKWDLVSVSLVVYFKIPILSFVLKFWTKILQIDYRWDIIWI